MNSRGASRSDQACRGATLGREFRSDRQRQLLERMASAERAHALFDELFRWFLIVHELTHALQNNVGVPATDDHAVSERRANDVAVAFFRETPESRRRLVDLAAALEAAKGRLPSLPELADEAAPDRYFDEHYDELTRDPPRYGAFRGASILTASAPARDVKHELRSTGRNSQLAVGKP